MDEPPDGVEKIMAEFIARRMAQQPGILGILGQVKRAAALRRIRKLAGMRPYPARHRYRIPWEGLSDGL